MSRKSSDAATLDGGAFGPLEMGRLTWMGLSLAAIGWIGLICEATIADVLVAKLPRPVTASFHADLLDIAICIIASGFSIAIIGALHTGFGALNRFFEAVLMRSSQRVAPVEPASSAHVEPTLSREPPKRPYRILADGSVEVETIVGTRKFDTLAEAKDFI